MGVDSREPKTPPLEMVKVPPVISSMVSLLSRAPGSEARDLLLDLGDAERIGIAQHRHDQPPFGTHRDADVVETVIDDLVSVDAGIDQREPFQRLYAGTHEETHEAEARTVVGALEGVPVARAQGP